MLEANPAADSSSESVYKHCFKHLVLQNCNVRHTDLSPNIWIMRFSTDTSSRHAEGLNPNEQSSGKEGREEGLCQVPVLFRLQFDAPQWTQPRHIWCGRHPAGSHSLPARPSVVRRCSSRLLCLAIILDLALSASGRHVVVNLPPP